MDIATLVAVSILINLTMPVLSQSMTGFIRKFHSLPNWIIATTGYSDTGGEIKLLGNYEKVQFSVPYNIRNPYRTDAIHRSFGLCLF